MLKTISEHLKEKYGRKIYKLCVDGGFSCPNRDKDGLGGCTFCSAAGAGEFTHQGSIAQQAEMQKQLLSKKWPDVLVLDGAKYLMHFQNYSGTYAGMDKLEALYKEALDVPGALGLVVSTRPDLLKKEHLDLFLKYSAEWVELGLQSSNPMTHLDLNTQYTPDDFEKSANLLHSKNLDLVAHVIYGLPGETDDDFFRTIEFVSRCGCAGIKIHMLNILKGSQLAFARSPQQWQKDLPSMDQYVKAVKTALEILPRSTIVHRLTGDGKHSDIIAPNWVKNKRAVLNSINRKTSADKQ